MNLRALLFVFTIVTVAPLSVAHSQTPTPSPTPTPAYRIDDLGLYVYPVGINDHSFVLSTEYDFGFGVQINYRGGSSFITEEGEYAIGINNDGQILYTDYSTYSLWTPDELNDVEGTPVSLDDQADGINDRGEVAGTSYGGSSPVVYKRSAAGAMTYYGTLGGSYTGATSINRSGSIVGRASAPSDDAHGALWSATASPSATPTDLGTLGGPSSLAVAINDEGDIAGSSTTSTGSWDRAFLRTNGVMASLGVLPGDFNSSALDLNGSRDVVGFSESEEDGPRAFVHTAADGLVNLNEKIDLSDGWTKLTNANAINECGQIVGTGLLYDVVEEYADTHGYLLTPRGTGMAYDVDPVTGTGDAGLEEYTNSDTDLLTRRRRCVRLQGLDGSGTLSGEYATTSLTGIQPGDTVDRVVSADGIFDYTRSETGFEEVMTYYHTDAVKRYLDELGFTSIRTSPLPIDASSLVLSEDDISGYSPSTNGIYFKRRLQWVDTAEDPMSIWHENFHAILDEVKDGFSIDPLLDESSMREARAFNEGAADYWAASRFAGAGRPGHEHDWDVYVGRWVGMLTNPDYPSTPPTPRFVTRVDSDMVYPGDYLDSAGKEHFNGQIWSSALWSIRQLPGFGRERTDKLLIRSLQSLTSNSARFRDIAKAFLTANNVLYAGADAAAIKTAFESKGIYFEVSSLALTPSTVVGGSGNYVTGEVFLSAEAPFGGAIVDLSESHSAASVPTTVTVPKGAISATFEIATSSVGATTSGNITATYDGKSVHANLDVTP